MDDGHASNVEVAGSSPAGRTGDLFVSVAQLDRALAREAKG